MNSEATHKARPKRRWFQFSLRTMFLATALLAAVAGGLAHFREHLLWRFNSDRADLSKVQRVPTAPMPAAETPDTWVACRFGSLELDLPRSLANGVLTNDSNSRILMLKDDTRIVHLDLPESADEFYGVIRQLVRPPPPALEGLSFPRLRLAAYEASWDDFRWSMSRDELRSHEYLVALAPLGGLGFAENVETLFREDMEGLLSVYGTYAGLNWDSTDGRACGLITFRQRSGDIDLEWVRPICHSLRFTGKCYPTNMHDDELQKLFVVQP